MFVVLTPVALDLVLMGMRLEEPCIGPQVFICMHPSHSDLAGEGWGTCSGHMCS